MSGAGPSDGAVLVTGAFGNVGREVVRALAARGARVLGADRDPERVRSALGALATPVRFDFRDAGTWPSALAGADRLFLVRPPAMADVERTLVPFLEAARAAGVGPVVFLSVAGAEKNRFVPHRKVEDHLKKSPAPYTLLRPGFFAQNLATSYREDIAEDDRIYLPAGKHPVNWVDVRDLAEVAALALTAPEEHAKKAYTLVGPGPVPWSAVTDALSAALGRPIRYEPASVLGYVRHLASRGLPAGAIFVQTVLHVLLRFGQGATEDPTLERLLGRPRRSIVDYVADHAALFERAPPAP